MRRAADPVALVLVGLLAAPAQAATACPTTGGSPARLTAVEPGLELRLADRRLIRLVGLEPAAGTPTTPERGETVRAALASLVGTPDVSVLLLSDRPDRWGRLPAWVFAPGTGSPGGLATAALAAGLGRYLPEPAAAACRDDLLAAEGRARGAGLGVWGDPYYSVLAVDDQAAFAERAGTNVLVEAELAAVEPGPRRTRLRFARPGTVSRGGRRFIVTIVPRAMKTFEAKGVDVAKLVGRTIRVRGLLDQRFGPQIELQNPDEIEVLPEAAATGPAH